MSKRPTPEQVAEARKTLASFGCGDDWNAAQVAKAVRVLYQATEPPTDEELDAEATALWKLGEADGEAPAMTWEAFRAVYRAGARRGDRRA